MATEAWTWTSHSWRLERYWLIHKHFSCTFTSTWDDRYKYEAHMHKAIKGLRGFSFWDPVPRFHFQPPNFHWSAPRFACTVVIRCLHFLLQLALDMWRKLMIEPLQAVLIRMLLNEIKKYVPHTGWAERSYFPKSTFPYLESVIHFFLHW